MTKQVVDVHELDTSLDGNAIGEVADAIVARGRAVVDRVPAVADGAREAFAGAQTQVNQLSDMGLVGALGFAMGLSSGLFVAGAPRLLLALSAVPVALTLRAALARGVGPDRLLS